MNNLAMTIVYVLSQFTNSKKMPLFKKKSPEEVLKQNQRALNRTIRELDRERSKLEQQEKKIIGDIKKMAKTGQMEAVKIMAKDLVRTRNFVKKFYLMKANLQAVSLKIQTLRSQSAMAQALKGVSKAMHNINSKMNLPQLQKIMMEFERETEIMDLKEELMSDTIDDVIGEADEDEESDAIVTQVLDELGVEVGDKLLGLGPSKEPIVGEQTADLEARLKSLKTD